ncbi:MAG: hypothetical protein ACFFCW_46855 [Candidatus Hodarchaeota archaeon]
MEKMKSEFTKQYAHTWRIFERLVKDFDKAAWQQAGRGVITPARLSLHIILGTNYYLEDLTPIHFASGKPFNPDWQNAKTDDLPTQDDIVTCIHEMQIKTEKWLSNLDYSASNETFPWAGETLLGIVIFLLRHIIFHVGELSSLLNESKNGLAEDHWVKTV